MATTLAGAKIQITERLEFEVVMCSACGTPMALEVDYLARRRDDHGTFYCVNGHTQYFPGKTEAEKLREQLAERGREMDGVLERLSRAERERVAAEAEFAKTKKRIHNGVCPECKRSFANVANHMKSKHGTPEEAARVAAEHKA
jgi:ssDNA-binding Zn-finger/Zn-ribbon topoisomerase 1